MGLDNTVSSLHIFDQSKVSLFENTHFTGKAEQLTTGSYDINHFYSTNTIGNDTLSSLTVPDGWVVRLYQHAGFSGQTLDVTSNQSQIGRDQFGVWNDKVSSLEIFDKTVELFEHSGYQGRNLVLAPGNYDMKYFTDYGFANDIVSSLKVSDGLTARVFRQDQFGGDFLDITADTTFIGSNWDDQVSSIVVF